MLLRIEREAGNLSDCPFIGQRLRPGSVHFKLRSVVGGAAGASGSKAEQHARECDRGYDRSSQRGIGVDFSFYVFLSGPFAGTSYASRGRDTMNLQRPSVIERAFQVRVTILNRPESMAIELQ